MADEKPAGAAPAEDDLSVDFTEIPLPPEDLIDALDNAPAAKAAAAVPDAPKETAELRFVDDRVVDVPLAFPFYGPDGAVVDSVAVRRLKTQEIGPMLRRFADEIDAFDIFEVYARMTGLSAATLRGLDADDGIALTGVCRDFLPRVLRMGA